MGTVNPPLLPTPEEYPWQCPLFELLYKLQRLATLQETGGCTGKAKEDSMFFNTNGCKNIGPEELNQKMTIGEDFLLLDVRTPQEHAAQAIKGSYLLPLQELGYRLEELPKNKEIVIYCRVGNRSAYACSYLSRMGYKVKNLEGGIVSWNMAGIAALAKA